MNTFSPPILSRSRRFRSKRRGISLVLFSFSLPIIFFFLAMVIDMGNLYNVRAQAQRAADAAALAGAVVSSGSNSATVIQTSKQYAALNGFTEGPTVRVIVQPSYAGGTASTASLNQVRVVVQRDAAVYFSPIMEGVMKAFGLNNLAVKFSRLVSTEAIADKIGDLPLNIPGFYGIADPSKTPANLSVFGPYSEYQWGDPYSVLYTQEGEDNPDYNPKGFEYTIKVGSNFKSSDNKMYLQIFDPDSYSPKGNSWDEVRSPNSKNKKQSETGSIYTTTQYDLIAPDGRTVSSVSYSGDPASNEQWVTPEGFNVDLNTYPLGDYTLRVHTTDGSSENGFALRAGPEEGLALTDTEWNQKYGDVDNTNPDNILVPIQAEGSLQMNFTKSGAVDFVLGRVSKDYAGKEITISKFDVDVGSQSITYKNSSLPNDSFAGEFPAQRNGTWSDDKITLPEGYNPDPSKANEGLFSVNYVAGAGDTSNWKISGFTNTPGRVYLSK